jgi:ferredoxin/flavodoxin---NADP+ reductase
MTPDQIEEVRKARYNATVVSLKKLHSDLMVIRIQPDSPRPPHSPGQYCTLGLGNWEQRVEGCEPENLKEEDLPKLVRRSYSLSCSILDESGSVADLSQHTWVEFYIVLVRQSSEGGRVPALTPRLFNLKPGDRVQLGEKIVGHFTLEAVQPGQNVVFLSTGTGEAPHNYMLWDLLKRQHTGKMLAACCVRFSKDLGYLSTHQQLMKQFPNYKYLPLTTREPGVTKKAYIQDLIASGELEEHLGAKLDPANTHVYLCGNPKMIGVPTKDKETGSRVFPQPPGVIELLEQRGFVTDHAATKTKGQVHFEEYW